MEQLASKQAVTGVRGRGAVIDILIQRRPALVGLFAALILLLVLPRSSVAQQPGRRVADDLWTMPEASAAWFAFDPTLMGPKAGDDPTRGLIEAGIRGLIANIATVEGGGSRVVSGMLNPAALGQAPYRVCLMSFAASPVGERVEPDRPIAIDTMAMVVEVRAAEGHEQLANLVRASLAEERPGRNIGAGTEVAAEFAGGIKGTAFSREGEGESRRIEWCSTPKAFVVGVGRGSIDRWLTATQPKGMDDAEWYLHRKVVAESRGKSDAVFEAFVSLDALRHGAPDEFAYGRLGRLAAAWHLANGRALMVHGRMAKKPAAKPGEAAATAAPPLLLVNVTYSMRSENPGVCHNIPVSEGTMPEAAELPMAVLEGCAIVARTDLEGWVGLILETWIALSPKAGSEAIAARTRWMRAHLAALERVKARMGKWTVLRTGQAPAAAIGVLPIAAGGKDRLEQDLREVSGSLSDAIKFDVAAKVWILKVEGAEFSWGMGEGGKSVVGGWGADALKKAK